MSKLDFFYFPHEKYNTLNINIWDASLKLENCEIIKKKKTEYGYQKVELKLST